MNSYTCDHCGQWNDAEARAEKAEAALNEHKAVERAAIERAREAEAELATLKAASPARARLMALKKAVERYDANDSDTSYYDAKEVCDAARALLVQITKETI